MKIFSLVFSVLLFLASLLLFASDQSIIEYTKDQSQTGTPNEQNIKNMEKEIADLKAKIKELESRIEHLTKLVETLVARQKDLKQTLESEKSKNQSTIKNKTEEQSDYVYVSKSGKKYHKQGCRFLVDGARRMTIDEAKKKKLEPCKFCFPESEDSQNKREK